MSVSKLDQILSADVVNCTIEEVKDLMFIYLDLCRDLRYNRLQITPKQDKFLTSKFKVIKARYEAFYDIPKHRGAQYGQSQENLRINQYYPDVY